MTEEFGTSVFERALEDPEEAVVTRPVAEAQGLQPEDLGVLVHLLLLPPTTQATGKTLAAGMRALGWKMSIDRFEVIAKRLTSAGHLLRRSVYNPKTKRPEWRYRAYRNPANNPQYIATGAVALSQVSGGIGENPVPERTCPGETGENPASPGQSQHRVLPGSGAESGKTRFPSGGVPTGESRNRGKPGFSALPPHPPEEEDSSSPNPLTRTKGSLPSPREEAREFPPEELMAAQDFLQRMQLWQAGLSTARRCAPRLLRAMRTQGWPSLVSMDDTQRRALEAEIFKNTGGAASWVKCLPGWVDDLRLYRKPVPAPTALASGAVRDDLVALRALCPACDQSGWVDDDGPMRRCTHPGITADTTKEHQ